MNKTPTNWIGEFRPPSRSTSSAFLELERAHEGELAKLRLANVRIEHDRGWFSRSWKTFAVAFVSAFLILNFLAVDTPPVVMVGNWLADPVHTGSK